MINYWRSEFKKYADIINQAWTIGDYESVWLRSIDPAHDAGYGVFIEAKLDVASHRGDTVDLDDGGAVPEADLICCPVMWVKYE